MDTFEGPFFSLFMELVVPILFSKMEKSFRFLKDRHFSEGQYLLSSVMYVYRIPDLSNKAIYYNTGYLDLNHFA